MGFVNIRVHSGSSSFVSDFDFPVYILHPSIFNAIIFYAKMKSRANKSMQIYKGHIDRPLEID